MGVVQKGRRGYEQVPMDGLAPAQLVRNDQLRLASGAVNDPRPLVGFIYELMRDYLPAGEVERLLRNQLPVQTQQFSNGWLARYAQELADQLETKERL